MDELPASELCQVKHLFESEHLALVIDAMVAGSSPAMAWVDDGARPRAAAVWDGAHCTYIAGAADRAGVFNAAVRQHIAPARPGLVKVYATDTAAAAAFAGHQFYRRERVFYRGGQLLIPGWRTRHGGDRVVLAVDGRLPAYGLRLLRARPRARSSSTARRGVSRRTGTPGQATGLLWLLPRRSASAR